MKKILSIILILTLLLTAIVFPAGCDLLDYIYGSPTNKPGNPSDGDGTVITPPSTDTDDKDDTAPDETPDDGDNNPDDGNNNGNGNEKPDDNFNDYGMNVITVTLSNINVTEKGIYNTKEEVGAYIYLYHKLPSNYSSSSNYVKNNYNAQNKLSYTGGTFQNREGLLPKASNRTYTECDIGYRGGNRNALRIVFSSDFLIFYTSDHYESFSIMRFV